jgi:hypothetical protein
MNADECCAIGFFGAIKHSVEGHICLIGKAQLYSSVA